MMQRKRGGGGCCLLFEEFLAAYLFAPNITTLALAPPLLSRNNKNNKLKW
jgi:hypothetical protein